MRAKKTAPALAMECIVYREHTAKVSPCKNGQYTIYCPDCKTRIFITVETYRQLDKAGKISVA